MSNTFVRGAEGESDVISLFESMKYKVIWQAPKDRSYEEYDLVIPSKIAGRVGVDVYVEVKNDDSTSDNIAIEFLQSTYFKNNDKTLYPSGIQKTKADYYSIVKRSHGTIYFVAVNELKRRIECEEYFIRDCNLNSSYGPTRCYIMNISTLKNERAFHLIKPIP